MGQVRAAYYLRMKVDDRPGVMADITRILADQAISIGSVIQKAPAPGEQTADIIFLTHEALEYQIDEAIGRIESLPAVRSQVIRLRREALA
jgi:homoserine dehydrogenase